MPPLLLSIVLVACGGAIGSVLRFLVSRGFVHTIGATAFPWPTFLINTIGSLILGGLAIGLLERLEPARRGWYLLFGTGFCGGFTTFSTFSLETIELLRNDRFGLALLYVVGSVVAGLTATYLMVRIMDR